MTLTLIITFYRNTSFTRPINHSPQSMCQSGSWILRSSHQNQPERGLKFDPWVGVEHFKHSKLMYLSKYILLKNRTNRLWPWPIWKEAAAMAVPLWHAWLLPSAKKVMLDIYGQLVHTHTHIYIYQGSMGGGGGWGVCGLIPLWGDGVDLLWEDGVWSFLAIIYSS